MNERLRLRTLHAVTWLLAAAIATGLGSAPAGASDRPNIIFVMTDDHANEAVSAYSGRINRTPHMDRLAAEGMRFDRAYVTNSICGPSRAVLLTGRHSHLNGMIGNIGARGVEGQASFDGAQQTAPKLLQAAGYQTAMIGKWHLRSEPTGFDHWEVLIGQGPYYNPPMRVPGGQNRYVGYTTDVITDLSLTWLENRDTAKPFVLYKHHKAPHREWKPGPDHLTRYDDEMIPEPPTLFDAHEGRTRAATLQTMSIATDLTERDLKLDGRFVNHLTEEQRAAWDAAYGPKNEAFFEAELTGRDLVRWKYQRYIKDYLRTIASVDDNLGRLLDYLDESGLAENTIVIYTSDQGFFLGEHGWYDKRWIYEESLRIPLIVRWPGVVEPGSVNDDLVQNLDFAQTFLDAAGVDQPDDMQGRSLVPLLRGETPDDWRRAIYYHYYANPDWHSVERHYGLRTDRYKLMHFYEQGDWELYDLKRDPYELTSAYGDPTYAGEVAGLKEELDALRERYEDRYSHLVPFEELYLMDREEIARISREGPAADGG